MLFALSVLAAAHGSPVRDALQAQILPEAYDFFAEELSGTTWPVGPTDFTGEWECYHEITIEGLNLSLELDRVLLAPVDHGIDLDVLLGEVRGENMPMRGDSDLLDVCLDFNTVLKYVELKKGHLEGVLGAKVEQRAISLFFPQPVELTGEMESDIRNFPDGVAWAFAENAVLNAVRGAIETELPAAVASLTADGFALSTFGGDVKVDLQAREVRAGTDGLVAAVDVDLGGDGGVGANLRLGPHGTSHGAVGLTASLAEEVLQAAWINSVFGSRSRLIGPLVDELLATLDLGNDVDVFYGLAAPPAVVIDPDGIFVKLTGLRVDIHAADGGELLTLIADANGTLDVRIVNGAFVLGVDQLGLAVRKLEAGKLLERDPDNLQAFMEGWAVDLAAQALDGITLWESHFEAMGYVLRVDHRELQPGGLVAWFTLFGADDPAVDRIAPDTTAQASVSGNTIHATYSGTDDRPGPLMFRARIDDRAWTRWMEETQTDLTELDPGTHVLEVVARDQWFNEDPTPAQVTFEIAGDDLQLSSECGCATPAGAGWGWMALLGLGLVRRRTED